MTSTLPRIQLRPVELDDIAALCAHQLDADANRMAVSIPQDAGAFRERQIVNMADPTVVERAIVLDGVLVGRICCFATDRGHDVGYWVGKEHWGRGVATQALVLLLHEVSVRPLYASVARSNGASIRVLERNGFVVTGYEMSVATERFPACEEAQLMLP